jgi:hypothetical protein
MNGEMAGQNVMRGSSWRYINSLSKTAEANVNVEFWYIGHQSAPWMNEMTVHPSTTESQ